MYDINLKNVKKSKGFFAVFLVAGSIFLAVMIMILVSSKFKENKLDASVMSKSVEITESRDSEGSIMYSPIYYYEVGGEEYTCKSSFSSNIYPSKDNKLVKYSSEDPGLCMTEHDKSGNGIMLFFMLIPIIFIAVGAINMVKVDKRVKKIKELNIKGKLVKGLPYRMENTGAYVNNVPIQRPVVDYVLPTGSVVTLQGDPRHDRKSFDADGLVDIVIDESDPTNYYIDFEINRLTGNLETDYYVNPNGQMPMQQPMMNGQVPMQQPMMNGQVPMQQPPYYPQPPVQEPYNQQTPNQNNF